jgi:hypothetical protein
MATATTRECHQWPSVAALRVPQLHDQAVSPELGVQVPVELRPAPRHHVRDVQVAEPPAGDLADRGPLPGDQIVIAAACSLASGTTTARQSVGFREICSFLVSMVRFSIRLLGV